MEKVRGSGGYWVLPGESHLGVVQHTAEYALLLEADLRPTRSVGSGGWEEGLLRYRRVRQASFRVAEADVSYPMAIGFEVGEELSVYLKRGELNSWDYLYRTLVQSVRRMKDEKKAIWVEVTCAFGAYSRDVPLGVELPAPPPDGEE